VRYRFLCVDKLRDSAVAALVREFRTRLARYGTIEEVDVPGANGGDPARAMRIEGERLLARIAPNETVWLLERTGVELDSRELAERITTLETAGESQITLVVAGAFGASDELLARAEFRWSLTRLTLLHEWARALVFEQLYRAAKIARGEPYHH